MLPDHQALRDTISPVPQSPNDNGVCLILYSDRECESSEPKSQAGIPGVKYLILHF
jgi:hypothetical protein